MGFCGVRASEYALEFAPSLPAGWQSVNFSVFYDGAPVSVSVSPEGITLDLSEAQPGRNLPVQVSGDRRLIECGRVHRFPVGEPVAQPGRVDEPAAAPELEPSPAY